MLLWLYGATVPVGDCAPITYDAFQNPQGLPNQAPTLGPIDPYQIIQHIFDLIHNPTKGINSMHDFIDLLCQWMVAPQSRIAHSNSYRVIPIYTANIGPINPFANPILSSNVIHSPTKGRKYNAWCYKFTVSVNGCISNTQSAFP